MQRWGAAPDSNACSESATEGANDAGETPVADQLQKRGARGAPHCTWRRRVVAATCKRIRRQAHGSGALSVSKQHTSPRAFTGCLRHAWHERRRYTCPCQSAKGQETHPTCPGVPRAIGPRKVQGEQDGPLTETRDVLRKKPRCIAGTPASQPASQSVCEAHSLFCSNCCCGVGERHCVLCQAVQQTTHPSSKLPIKSGTDHILWPATW